MQKIVVENCSFPAILCGEMHFYVMVHLFTRNMVTEDNLESQLLALIFTYTETSLWLLSFQQTVFFSILKKRKHTNNVKQTPTFTNKQTKTNPLKTLYHRQLFQWSILLLKFSMQHRMFWMTLEIIELFANELIQFLVLNILIYFFFNDCNQLMNELKWKKTYDRR